MYKQFILKGVTSGATIGLIFSAIFAFLTCVILAASSSQSALALGYFLMFFLYGINLGILPATMFGAISGLVVGTLVFVEWKIFNRLGTVRIIFWRIIGLLGLLTLVINGVEYRHWIWKNPLALMMPVMYFGGLIWVVWQLYHQKQTN